MLCCIFSGGVKLVYIGSDLDVVQIVLIIDIVDSTVSNSTIVEMSYSIVSFCLYACICISIHAHDYIYIYIQWNLI